MAWSKASVRTGGVRIGGWALGCWAAVLMVSSAAAAQETPPPAMKPAATVSSEDHPDETQPKSVSEPSSREFEQPKTKDTETTTSGKTADHNDQVEINADRVEFDRIKQVVTASGNVVVKKGEVTLFCDALQFYKNTMTAYASGRVLVVRGRQRLLADEVVYRFNDETGEFKEPRIAATPFYGKGKRIEKVGENHIRIIDGYLTTSDFDKPEYRIEARRIDVYPGVRAVARGVRLKLGETPLLYLPKYTQDLRDREPFVQISPGYDSDWGAFLLTTWKYQLSEAFKGKVHLDYRQRRDLAWGVDADYDTKVAGRGVVRTYYMNERFVHAKYFWDERTPPTTERERFKIEWRHQWRVDPKTQFTMQVYRLSDAGLLKDYFENEYNEDRFPETFFLVTRQVPTGVVSLRSDVRINRFESKLERLPELQYTQPSLKLGQTGLYWTSTSRYSNLVKKEAAPSDSDPDTMRVSTDNEIAYPMKISFFDVKPFVGGTHVYYSRTADQKQHDLLRGQFRTGADISFRMFRIYDTKWKAWGLDINRLRHVITPSVRYEYAADPTAPDRLILQLDEADSLSRRHQLLFGVEQKWQTKRKDKVADLMRLLVEVPYRLKEDPDLSGFGPLEAEWEVRPLERLSFLSDFSYDTQTRTLTEANFDLYINRWHDLWYASVGHRYHASADDQVTLEWGVALNPKWKFRVYQRFDTEVGVLQEQEYALQRDLHTWLMEINFNQTRSEGSEIWLVFTLKAFDEISFDFGTSFNRRKGPSLSP